MNLKRLLLQPSTGHVLMVSFLLAFSGAVLLSVEQSLASAENAARKSLGIAVLFQSSVSDVEARKVADGLSTQDPAVQDVQFLSQQEALHEAQKDPALARSLLVLKANPLPASAVIRLKDEAWLNRNEPGNLFKSIPQIGEIRWDPQARTAFRSLYQWRVWLMRMAIISCVALACWALFGVYRFVSLRSALGELAGQLALGSIGGAFAFGLWALSLQRLGMDASLYRPQIFVLLPLLTGATSGIACFGLGGKR